MKHRVAIITAMLMAIVMAGCGSSDTGDIQSSSSTGTSAGTDEEKSTIASSTETDSEDGTTERKTSAKEEVTSKEDTSEETASEKTTSEKTASDSDDTDSKEESPGDDDTKSGKEQSDDHGLPEPVSKSGADDQTEDETSVLDEIGNDISETGSGDAGEADEIE